MDERADMAGRLEACFEEIAATRMEGVPILNHALSVQAVGGRDWSDGWLCVLITPWFMNLMFLPGSEKEPGVAIGTKRNFAFPAGQFEFIAGQEDGLGHYWMCSLFSPVFEFPDQEAAEATALAAIDALFETDDETDGSETAMARMWRGETPEDLPEAEAEESDGESVAIAAPRQVSRRAFLCGGASEDRP